MNLYILLTLLALALGTWIAALKLALLRRSRAVVAHRLEVSGREKAARWLSLNFDAAISALSLLRSVTRIAVFVLVLAETVNLRTEAALSWPDLAISGGISIVILWLFTSVLAAALASHVGAGLVSTGLPLIQLFTRLSWPFTRPASFVDEIVRRLSGANLRDDDEIEAELLRSIDRTQIEGGLDEAAAGMLENVVEFTNTDVAEIMTPRTDIEGIELTDDLVRIRAFIAEVGHSRIPVYRENLDTILGILYVRDLVPLLGENAADFRLEPLLRHPIIVPGSKPVHDLLADFQTSEVHMAIVVDEYGGVSGLATIEDVIEQIVGDIDDEHDPEEARSIEDLGNGRHSVAALTRIEEFNEHFEVDLDDEEYETIGGLVMHELGRLPRRGEQLEFEGFRFRVLRADRRRIHTLEVSRLEPPVS